MALAVPFLHFKRHFLGEHTYDNIYPGADRQEPGVRGTHADAGIQNRRKGDSMEFETISPREIDGFLFREGYVIIDIREPRDFRKLHLKGAVCIPYEQLEERVRFLKNQTLILYCERGGASLKAARELSEKGYRVKTMIGGIQAYEGRNYESYGVR